MTFATQPPENTDPSAADAAVDRDERMPSDFVPQTEGAAEGAGAAEPAPAKSASTKRTSAKTTAAKGAATKATAAKGTAAKGTSAKGTSAKGNAAKSAAPKGGATAKTASGTKPATPRSGSATGTGTTKKTTTRTPATRRPATAAASVVPTLADDQGQMGEATTVPEPKPKDAAAKPVKKAPRAKKAAKPAAVAEPTQPPARTAPDPSTAKVVLSIQGLVKRFGRTTAVDGVCLNVLEGSFYGIVGPNGAGKTTTLSMVTGLLRPDAGSIIVHDVDVWANPTKAKHSIGVLPDRLRLFDRLTGAQLLFYSGTLRGLDADTVKSRSADLAKALGLDDALNRLVADYSAGMTKKIALAAAMIHSPRLLVLDEPFESVDPVSAANVIEILQKYVHGGGTVVLSSHGMDLIQRVCDSVAIIVRGRVLASGTVTEVRGDMSLEDRFVQLAGGRKAAEGMEWLHSFSD